jgi:threonyl-tRNA synthetase
MQKIPYMLVIGSKEMAGEKLQIRQRDGKQFSMDEKEFITHIHEMIDKKKNIE